VFHCSADDSMGSRSPADDVLCGTRVTIIAKLRASRDQGNEGNASPAADGATFRRLETSKGQVPHCPTQQARNFAERVLQAINHHQL
jgi:hypothetical protein